MLQSLFVAAMFFNSLAAIHHAENVSVVVQIHAIKSVVVDYGTPESTVTATHDEDTKARCSGYIASATGTTEIIVTARHCVVPSFSTDDSGDSHDVTIEEDLTPVAVNFFDGDTGKVTEIWPAQDHDLAVLVVQSRRKHSESAFATNKSIARGEVLFGFGMPDGFEWSYTTATAMQGDVQANGEDADLSEFGPEGAARLQDMVLLGCPLCYGGNSGGAVFNDDGQVVGTFSLNYGSNAGYFGMTPAKDIILVLKAFGDRKLARAEHR